MRAESEKKARPTSTTTVAFLQCLWMKQPERGYRLFEDYPEMREEILAKLLFLGGLTGRRLQNAFGAAVEEIVWEEITPQIAGDAKTIFPADHKHIARVMEKHRPGIVIAFGQIAGTAIADHLMFYMRPENLPELILCYHPAARQAGVMERLSATRDQWRALQGRTMAA